MMASDGGPSFLITYLPQTKNPFLSFLLVAVGYVIITGYTSINAIVKAELFPFHIRALGVGLGYALANSIFGGTSPVIYEVARSANQVGLFIAYVTVCIALSLLVYIFALRNKSETAPRRGAGLRLPAGALRTELTHAASTVAVRAMAPANRFYVGPDQGSSASCTWRGTRPTRLWPGRDRGQ